MSRIILIALVCVLAIVIFVVSVLMWRKGRNSCGPHYPYRLGDFVRYHNKYMHEVDPCRIRKCFPDTIAERYGTQTNLANDFATLVKVTREKCTRDNIRGPSIAVHVRLGDIICGARNNSKDFRLPPSITEFQQAFFRLPLIGSPTIFFAAHNGCNKESGAYAQELCKALGGVLAAPAAPDNHFCQMVLANTFIQGKGGYSEMIRAVRAEMGKESISIPPFSHGGSYEVMEQSMGS